MLVLSNDALKLLLRKMGCTIINQDKVVINYTYCMVFKPQICAYETPFSFEQTVLWEVAY
jgi:hypothetical protein